MQGKKVFNKSGKRLAIEVYKKSSNEQGKKAQKKSRTELRHQCMHEN